MHVHVRRDQVVRAAGGRRHAVGFHTCDSDRHRHPEAAAVVTGMTDMDFMNIVAIVIITIAIVGEKRVSKKGVRFI
jgi:hypothetical protein